VKPDADLFRRESARLVASLTRAFGVGNLALVEDVVQETLARAFAAWSHGGVPEHHAPLLMTAARNRALDVFRRERNARRLAPELQHFVESERGDAERVEDLFLPDALRDDELRMMFSCCHPRLNQDVQVALILNILCGFGLGEVASAFLLTEAAAKKRLTRGKKVLAESKRLFELTAEDFESRLSAVQEALYLLFSEGYHGATDEPLVRVDLCREAMRLARLLVDHAPSATPASHALAALMCLHAARLPGRVDEGGNLRALIDQDRSTWDANLITDGLTLLQRSGVGTELSVYHLEAAISARHAAAASVEETPWGEIAELYGVLLKLQPSPVVALNRAMAVAQHEGPARGLEEIHKIHETERLARYPFYSASLGELERRLGRLEAAATRFRTALTLARNDGERRFLEQRLSECERKPGARG
jgi:RNA polymerase sigma-70 factor (ECF subfamily)